jgi:uridine monophosphate synthetase
MPTFSEKLEARARQANSLLCVGLDPHADLLRQLGQPGGKTTPLGGINASQAYDFCRRMVDATHPHVCAFKLNSAFFEALGSLGFESLRAAISYIRQVDPSLVIILDGKRGDIASTADAYARAAFDYFDADAITISPYLGADAIAPFLARPDRGAFVLAATSNPGGRDFQALAVEGRPLYCYVAETLSAVGGQGLGFVAGATNPDALAQIREAAGNAWLLVPGVGVQGGDLAEAVRAGRRADGLGVIINASRSVAQASDPRQEALRLKEAINAARAQPPLRAAPQTRQLALALVQTGCIRFGTFTLKSGLESPFYLDLRRLVANPKALQVVAYNLAQITARLSYDQIAAIPYAALPIGTALALQTNKPLLYPRREVKEYGTKAAVEGVFSAGQTALLLDDLATTGQSKFEAIDKLTSVGLRVRDIVVVVDREQGARGFLEQEGYGFHAAIGIAQLMDELQGLGLLKADKRAEIGQWLERNR